MSLSAVFMEAVRIERQMEARRTFLAFVAGASQVDARGPAAIHAEWDGGPRYEPTGKPNTRQHKAKKKAPPSKKRRAA